MVQRQAWREQPGQDRRADAGGSQLERFLKGAHAEPAGAGGERRTGYGEHAVAVPVGFDHGHDLGVGLGAQAADPAAGTPMSTSTRRNDSATSTAVTGPDSAAWRPARPCTYAAATAAWSAARPPASNDPSRPARTSPVPAVASAGVPVGLA